MTVEEALIIVEKLLEEGLTKVQEIVFRGSWQGKSYLDIAKEAGYDSGYIKDTGSKLWQLLSEALGVRVLKHNFRSVLQRWSSSVLSQASNLALEKNTLQYDWGEAVDTTSFYGRVQELATLEQWVLQERSRLIVVLGLGGMGKTTLTAKLIKQILSTSEKQSLFDYCIWRSLRNAPLIEATLVDLLQFLSMQQEIVLPETIDRKINLVLHYLKQYRCLIVLDNVETILDGERVGSYRAGYEGYGQLLRGITDGDHQSVVILTSREKPKGLALKEGKELPVRILQLQGLQEEEGQKIFHAKGFVGSETQWNQLIEHYHGNPLALKIAATNIQELFDNDIAAFLEQGTTIFGDIWDLIDQQFSRLSALEHQIMYWLAVNRQWISFAELRDDTVPLLPQRELLTALESLQQRSLIQKQSATFTQQPAVMEYVTYQLIEHVTQEIITGKIDFLNRYALIKAQSEDYLQDAQTLLILKPVVDRLLQHFRSQKRLEQQLVQILQALRQQASLQPGYAGGNVLNLLCYMKRDLEGANFSNLAIWQADLKNVNLHNVDFSDADFAKSTFTDTFSSMLALAFSPDGNQLITAGGAGQIWSWDVAGMKPLFTCRGSTQWIFSIAFSPDGQTFANVGGDDRTVRIWDASTSQCLRILRGHTRRTWEVAYSPDSQLLASASDDGMVRVWEVETGQCLKVLQGTVGQLRTVAFSPDGQLLAAGGVDCSIVIWAVQSGECLNVLHAPLHLVQSLAFSPDSELLISAGNDCTIKLWDIRTWQLLNILQGHKYLIRVVRVSPDGRTIASGSHDQAIRLWDIASGHCVKILQGHTSTVWSIAFSPDGKTLASSSDDQMLKLWDVPSGRCRKTLRGHNASIWSVAFSPDGNTLMSGSSDRLATVWDIQTGRCIKVLRGHDRVVFSVAYSPDGTFAASSSGTIKLWDLQTGACLKTLQGHTNWIWAIAFAPQSCFSLPSSDQNSASSQILASASSDQTVKLWDIQTGECLKTFQGHSNWVFCVVFHPDGQMLASAGDDCTVKIWDVSTGNCIRTLVGHSQGIWGVTFSPDGQTLASASDDCTVKIWDVSTGNCLKTLTGHENLVHSVTFGANSQTLISASDDRTLKIWDLETGTCLNTLRGHTDLIRAIAISLDKKIIASGGQDETIKLWDLATSECLKTLSSERPYQDMNITEASGLTEAQKVTLKALGAIEK